MTHLQAETARRRTFAIISHPDAGKTTLTEKLLLFGGAIALAGRVKARGEMRRARSDWMKVEQERGISVTASVMTFEYQDHVFNLLDTPGHEDFSEDTYRTLTAVDSAIMVIDAAKGIETQTLKLFEVCRMRNVPIITFINKMDRDGRDSFELLEEIEQRLQLEVSPITWPIGSGRAFAGCYDLLRDRLLLVERGQQDKIGKGIECSGLDDPQIAARVPADLLAKFREEVELVRHVCPPFDEQAYREGDRTPVLFGSALHNFGVLELLEAIGKFAPSPRSQLTVERTVQASETEVSGFVFKIQANMDPRHRDRVAFVRLCSGRFERGMKLFHPRSGRQFAIHNPLLFLARERELAEEAFAGDILGIPNHGNLHIGDALTQGETLHFRGIPSFAPELLRKVRPIDPMRAKHLGRALQQLAEEGAAQVFRARIGADWIMGVAGALQFDVLADRIRTEYEIEARFEGTALTVARWIVADDEKDLREFIDRNETKIAEDHTGSPVYLAASSYYLDRAREDWPKVRFLKTREQVIE